MAGLNKVILIGRVGKDPDTFQFDDGTKKMSFSLATTESYRDKGGEWKDSTEWHNIVGYRYLAEKNIAKGDLLYVEGKIKSRKYNDKDGNERYITEIVSEKINILIRQQAGQSGNYNSGQNAQDSKSDIQNSEIVPEDDLPF
jgi:single-strand DNA-binding protein